MKSLSAKTFQCGVTVQGLTTLSGTVYLTALTNTATWDYVVVGTTAQGQLYTRTYAQLMSDITSGIGLSGYVPTSRTLTINGVSYDLTANRSWTISTVDYTSRLQHQVKAGVAINKGQAVYVTSADGTNMIVGLASNASEATSSKTMGLLDATVSTNGFANVVTEGLLAGLDTSTAGTEGDPVWLGTGGNLIYGLANKPYAPAHLVFIGIVTRKNNSNGEIFVKVQNGFELNEIHDVDLKTNLPVNGELLGFNGTLWVNKTIAGWLGYTPANASGTTNYISKFTGSTTLGNSLIYDDGTNVGIGTTSPNSKLSIGGGDNGSGVGVLELFTSGGTNLKLGGNIDYSWIQSHSSKPLRINELGNNVILNLGGGNVGIGTSSPAYKLQVAGGDIAIDYNRYLRGGAGGDWNLVNLYNGGTGDIEITMLNANWYLRHNANATFAGKIGIGTTNPVSKLHVLLNGNTSGGPTGNVASFQNSSAGNNAYISLFGAYNAEAGIIFTDESEQYKGKIGYDNISEYMYFQTDGSEKVRITAAGNVGIGTTNPATQLTLNKVAGNAMLQLINASESAFSLKTYNSGSGTVQGSVFMQYLDYSSTINGYMAYHRGGGGSDGFLSFGDNGGERVRFANGGNVGIGVTNPSYKLDVNGSFNAVTSGVYLTYNSGIIYHGSSYYQFPSGSYYYLYGRTGMGLIFGSNNAEVGRFDLSGNLGIGTTDPQRKLDSYTLGGAFTGNNYVRFGVGAAGAYGGNNHLEFSYNDYGNVGGRAFDNIVAKIQANTDVVSSTDVGGTLIFSTKATGGTYLTAPLERMRITSGGNIGIGTASPAFKLEVNAGSNAGMWLQGSSDVRYHVFSSSSQDWVGYELRSSNANTFAGGIFRQNTSNNRVSLYNKNSEAISLMDTGLVGVGTTSPSQQLHVSGNIRVTGAFYDSNNQAGTAGQILKSTGTGTDWVSLSEITGVDGSGTANYVTKWSDADTITNSLIYDNGTNVGIGTTSPGYNFDVNGQVRVQDKLRVGTVNSGNGVVHMSSTATINPSATTIVWAQNVSVGMCAFIDYYILNNNTTTDQRAGTIMVTWNQSGTPTIAHTETTTPDIGSTIAVNFTSSLVGSDARINAVNSSANPYTIVMSYKYF